MSILQAAQVIGILSWQLGELTHPHLFLIFFPISSNFIPPPIDMGPKLCISHPLLLSTFLHFSTDLLPTCQVSIHSSISQHVHLCIISIYYLFVNLCIYHLFVRIINLSCLSICLSIYPLIYLSVHLSILSSSGV